VGDDIGTAPGRAVALLRYGEIANRALIGGVASEGFRPPASSSVLFAAPDTRRTTADAAPGFSQTGDAGTVDSSTLVVGGLEMV
jgi:hypothetical protein